MTFQTRCFVDIELRPNEMEEHRGWESRMQVERIRLARIEGEHKRSADRVIHRHYLACAIAITLLGLLGALALAHAGIQRQNAYYAAEARV
jgi:hypothetical protein